MQKLPHPNLDDLLGYLAIPESTQYKTTVLHLATCGRCRQKVTALDGLMQQLRQQVEANQSMSGEPGSLHQLADYVDDNLNENDREVYRETLNSDPLLLKHALYYASQSSALRRQVNSHRPITKARFNRLYRNISEWIFQRIRFTAWFGIPVTAVALVFLVILIVPIVTKHEQDQVTIASYQDNPVITFTQSKQHPGIGFFDAAKSIQKPYKGIDVSMDDAGRFHMQWVPVSGAKNYTIRLYLIGENERLSVFDSTSTTTQAIITGHSPSVGRRYEWELSGVLENETLFRSRGGFIVMNSKF